MRIEATWAYKSPMVMSGVRTLALMRSISDWIGFPSSKILMQGNCKPSW